MSLLRVSLGQIRFKSVTLAFKESGYHYEDNDHSAVLVWHDSIKDIDYFRYLQPWQVVNRIPCINILCRKAPLARIIQKISPYFPKEYSFYPKTYILPFKNHEFLRAISKRKCRYIVKPDSGSLGQGITIVDPGTEYSPDDTLAIAQEYIQSMTYDDTKFDLRVYAVITSVSPLEVFVFRGGLARFCSEKVGRISIYSQITNVTLNKSNLLEADNPEISRLISDVFPLLEKEYGINTDDLWKKIDKVIVLTIAAAYNYLLSGLWKSNQNVYSRCFQILGFDILLDTKWNPYVLEVNYRPSLDYSRPVERRMKVEMIRDAVRIGSPLNAVQAALDAQKIWWDESSWSTFINNSQELINACNSEKSFAISNSNYVKVYPCSSPDNEFYNQVLEKSRELPLDQIPGFRFPKSDSKAYEA